MGATVDWGVLWHVYAVAGVVAATLAGGGVVGWCYVRVVRLGRRRRVLPPVTDDDLL
jgi:hypothetical protein